MADDRGLGKGAIRSRHDGGSEAAKRVSCSKRLSLRHLGEVLAWVLDGMSAMELRRLLRRSFAKDEADRILRYMEDVS